MPPMSHCGTHNMKLIVSITFMLNHISVNHICMYQSFGGKNNLFTCEFINSDLIYIKGKCIISSLYIYMSLIATFKTYKNLPKGRGLMSVIVILMIMILTMLIVQYTCRLKKTEAVSSSEK